MLTINTGTRSINKIFKQIEYVLKLGLFYEIGHERDTNVEHTTHTC